MHRDLPSHRPNVSKLRGECTTLRFGVRTLCLCCAALMLIDLIMAATLSIAALPSTYSCFLLQTLVGQALAASCNGDFCYSLYEFSCAARHLNRGRRTYLASGMGLLPSIGLAHAFPQIVRRSRAPGVGRS